MTAVTPARHAFSHVRLPRAETPAGGTARTGLAAARRPRPFLLFRVLLRCPQPSRSRDAARRYEAEPTPESGGLVSRVSGLGPLPQSSHSSTLPGDTRCLLSVSAHKFHSFSILTKPVARTVAVTFAV